MLQDVNSDLSQGLREVFRLSEQLPVIPLEAIVKTDLLRLGVSFSKEALEACKNSKPKSYFIFSFDRTAQKDLSPLERKVVPEEIALISGPHKFKRTIVSVRVHPESPYRIISPPTPPLDLRGGRGEIILELFYQTEKICDVQLPTFPEYYAKPLASGKPVSDIAPTIEWGYLIYLTAFRLCQYFGAEEECQFCDINHNYRQQKPERSYTGIKSIDEILEALTIIHENDPHQLSHAYTVTGGSITSKIGEHSEADFYAQYARAIEKKFPGRWLGKAVVQGLPQGEAQKLKDAGYQIYHPNYEVWDKEIFSHVCPGKERYVGRDEWIRRIIDGAKVFGASSVIPNFVAGVEMSKPYGFDSIDKAIRSTSEGLEFFMSQEICPRFTVWCVEPNTVLAKTNEAPPPLEYYVRLLEAYQSIFKKHKLPIPPGYGEAGLGKAVFSVSAFMDVL